VSESDSPAQSPAVEPVPAAPAAATAAPNMWLVMVAAWLVPGGGHFVLGRRGRAVAFLLIVLAALGIGLMLDGNLHRIVPNRPLTVLATLACMGLGTPYFLLRFGLDYQGEIIAPGFEYGTAFILTAGLMNLLLILDSMDIASGRKS